jgi:hypothetical protein
VKTIGTVLKAVLLICWLAVIVSACAEAPPDHPALESSDALPSSVTRFIDHDYGNVCYIFIGFEKGGISCVPLRE